MTGRRTELPLFLIDVSPGNAAQVWECLCSALERDLRSALVDVYPSSTWTRFEELPAQVRHAASELERIARTHARRRGDPLMALELDCSDPAQLALLRTFGPWSIHVEVYRANGSDLIGMHDEGSSCWAILSGAELALVESAFAKRGLDVVPRLPERRKRWWRRV